MNCLPNDVQQIIVRYLPIEDWESLDEFGVHIKSQTKRQKLLEMKEKGYIYLTELESLKAVQQEGYALQYVNNQTDQVCLAAVQENGNALQYVNNQTEELCLSAVQENSYALQYVNNNNQTENVCLAAIQKNSDAIKYIRL